MLVREPDRQPSTGRLRAVEPRSLAVLLFDNVGGDPANEYFSDGVTEEILNTVEKLPGLRVASRTSSFSFKEQNVAIDQIAERLKVAHVLEGSVRRFEQRIVISAQLIDAQTDRRVGDREAAVRMLTQAFNTREANIVFLAVDSDLELLRSDPRISSILRRMGLR